MQIIFLIIVIILLKYALEDTLARFILSIVLLELCVLVLSIEFLSYRSFFADWLIGFAYVCLPLSLLNIFCTKGVDKLQLFKITVLFTFLGIITLILFKIFAPASIVSVAGHWRAGTWVAPYIRGLG